jgi:hypothetical protein
MKISELKRRTLEPFNSLGLAKRYFSAVKAMDSTVQRVHQKGVQSVLKLWAKNGELTITGPEPIGERNYRDLKELREFYGNRGKGVDKYISVNISRVGVATAKSAEHITVSGMRYVVNNDGEGLQVPFTHNFHLADGLIQRLHINVGRPASSEVAPVGTLQVEDMGRLAAVAWMVA